MDRGEQIILQRLPSEVTEIRAFVFAVIRHLAGPSAGSSRTMEITDQVARILHHVGDSELDPSVAMLLESPEVLASFFQNADLLDPISPVGTRIVRLINEAVGRVWEEGS